MCIILRISIKTNPKIYCGLGGVYFRVITLDSASQILLQFLLIFDLKHFLIKDIIVYAKVVYFEKILMKLNVNESSSSALSFL